MEVGGGWAAAEVILVDFFFEAFLIFFAAVFLSFAGLLRLAAGAALTLVVFGTFLAVAAVFIGGAVKILSAPGVGLLVQTH